MNKKNKNQTSSIVQDSELNKTNGQECEYCGSTNLLEWFYGLPPRNTDLSKYKMAGCIVEDEMFTHYCNDCSKSSGMYYFDAEEYINELAGFKY